jgi:Aldehyde dehydrogenase family
MRGTAVSYALRSPLGVVEEEPQITATPPGALAQGHWVQKETFDPCCHIAPFDTEDLRTAFGGAKASGIGREGGVHSLEFYTELRNVMVKL